MDYGKEFRKYATGYKGISSSTYDKYMSNVYGAGRSSCNYFP
jgi:hypothetical protein